MSAASKLILGRQLRPVWMQRQEPRVWLNECTEAQACLQLPEFASHGLPEPALLCGSAHLSGGAA